MKTSVHEVLDDDHEDTNILNKEVLVAQVEQVPECPICFEVFSDEETINCGTCKTVVHSDCIKVIFI